MRGVGGVRRGPRLDQHQVLYIQTTGYVECCIGCNKSNPNRSQNATKMWSSTCVHFPKTLQRLLCWRSFLSLTPNSREPPEQNERMKTVRKHHVSAPLTGVGQVASSLGTDRQSSPVAVAMKNFLARPGAISRAGSQDERRRLLVFSRTASCRLYPLQRTANRVPCVPGTGSAR